MARSGGTRHAARVRQGRPASGSEARCFPHRVLGSNEGNAGRRHSPAAAAVIQSDGCGMLSARFTCLPLTTLLASIDGQTVARPANNCLVSNPNWTTNWAFYQWQIGICTCERPRILHRSWNTLYRQQVHRLIRGLCAVRRHSHVTPLFAVQIWYFSREFPSAAVQQYTSMITQNTSGFLILVITETTFHFRV